MQRTFELLQPLWLLALVPGLAALVLASGRTAGRSSWLRVCLKALCLACLAVALSSPRMACGRRQLCRIFVVDRSASVLVSPNAARECVTQGSSRMDPEDLIGVVSFGRQPSVDVPPRKAHSSLPSTLFSSAVEREGTDIESALRLAASLAPAGCDVEIVLLTDGNENAGDSRPAVTALAGSGIRVSAVALQRSGLRDTRVEHVEAPATVRELEPFEAVVTAGSTFNTKAILRVFGAVQGAGRSELAAVRVTLYPGRSAQISVSLPPQKEPVGTYEARLETEGAADDCPANDSASFAVCRLGRIRVAYISNGQDRGVETLLGMDESLDVQKLTSQDKLELFDAVVMDNVGASRLNAPFIKRIGEFVTDQGGGLLMLGGDESFGSGGYARTPVEDVLPVLCRPRHFVSVAILLDSSHSMAEKAPNGAQKFQLAREALDEALLLLEKEDDLEVISFTQQVRVTYPLQSMAGVSALAPRLAAIEPYDGTALIGPVETALADLKKAPDEGGRHRHVIVLSDLLTTEPVERIRKSADALARERISCSVVLTSPEISVEQNGLIEILTQGGANGRHFHARDISKLAVFLKDDLSREKNFFIERSIRPQMQGMDGLVKTQLPPAPELRGMNNTTLKDRAKGYCTAETKEPLLAAWQCGTGRSVAFTSCLDSRWGEEWRTWPGAFKFFSLMLRWVARQNQGGDFRIHAEVSERFIEVVAASSGKGDTSTAEGLVLKFVGPDGSSGDVTMSRTGPGTWQARVPAAREGTYTVSVFRAGPGGKLTPVGQLAVAVSVSPELSRLEPNLPLLNWINEAGAGKAPDAPETRVCRTAVDVGWLFAAAAGVFLISELALSVFRTSGLSSTV